MPTDLEVYGQRPARVTISNVETAESISAQYNPEEVEETLGAAFSELEVLGLSHKPQQFKQVENLDVQIDLVFDALTFGGSQVKLLTARAFLHSFFANRRGSQTVEASAPPRMLLSWPNLYSLTCRVPKCKIKMSLFRRTMHPTLMTATLTLKEARITRLYSDDVFLTGTLR